MNHEVKLWLRDLSHRNNVFHRIYVKTSSFRTFLRRRLSDECFLKAKFEEATGKELNLENPMTFNEKLQWLKLHDRNPIYTTMVDKFAVKQLVADKIGKEYVIPTLGVWERFNEIDFKNLPNQFALKCTHDSGSVILCRDKSHLNIEAARKQLNLSLKKNYYYEGREWPYKNVPPRIIAEELLQDDEYLYVADYKFFCFHGQPKFLYVGRGLTIDHSLKISFFDLNWKTTPFTRTDYDTLEHEPPPARFTDMISIARTLSEGIPFVRVDLYCIKERVFFSEFTFSPGGGHLPFKPETYDLTIGSWLMLPSIMC